MITIALAIIALIWCARLSDRIKKLEAKHGLGPKGPML